MAKHLINPQQLYDGSVFGMSQGVVAPSRNLLFVSGQVAWDKQHAVTGDTVGTQFEAVLANLKIVLDEAGASVNDLLQIRIYIRGEFSEHLEALAPLLTAFLGTSRPAVTGIGVASLASPDTLVEVEAVAGVGVSEPAPAGQPHS